MHVWLYLDDYTFHICKDPNSGIVSTHSRLHLPTLPHRYAQLEIEKRTLVSSRAWVTSLNIARLVFQPRISQSLAALYRCPVPTWPHERLLAGDSRRHLSVPLASPFDPPHTSRLSVRQSFPC